MRQTDYKWIVFDAQYFLVRNFSALQSRTKYDMVAYLTPEEGDPSEGYVITKYNFSRNDLVKQFFWTIAKVIREKFDCHKVILVWDKSPYHKHSFLPDYKGTRVHPSQALLDDWDVQEDPAGYLQMKENVRIEQIKSEAKYWIIDNLGSFGMPSVIHSGYEADDLAYIFSHLPQVMSSEQKSAICSVDSDWMFWISNRVDFINFNKDEAWTYEDVSLECEEKDKKLGIDLFDLKKYMDSTFSSHNDLMRVTNLGWKDLEQLYHEIQNQDYTNITDVERLNNNLKSFDIIDYPEYDQVVEELTQALFGGKKGDMSTYTKLKNKGFSVSENYSRDYLGTLTDSYYESTDNS